ncbi:hypothetical protein QQX98_007023 [Neonectria punicea]|uniref:Uncharacterized protein n=1 Tax=Neonectria punicea TaxID=979145 RepID=A0ABR1GZ37_9HYPO
MDVSNTGGETMIDYYTNGTTLIANAHGDKPVFQYSCLPITGFRNRGANSTLPAPTQERLEAMAPVEDLALCLMHARNAFDIDEKGKPLPLRRHLVKMMLQDPELK